MKNSQFFAILLLSFLAACQKEDQPQPQPGPEPGISRRLVKMTNHSLPNQWTQFKYDAQGRVILTEDYEDKQTLKYVGNEVHVTEFRKSENRTVFDFTGKLNAKGNIMEGAATSSYTGKAYAQQYAFEYDAGGNLTKETMNRDNGALIYEYVYTYKNGNLHRVDAYMNGKLDYSGEYEYFTDQENKWKINWEQFNVTNTFTGNFNKNMMSKYTGYRDGKESWHVNYTYNFDAEGYPVSGMATYSDGDVYSFTYNYE